MSVMSDVPGSTTPARGDRAFGRLHPGLAGRWSGAPRTADPAGTAPVGTAPVEAMPIETVTLGKVGDFLEIDFRRLFVWLRRGLLGSVLLGVVGAGLGGAYAVLSKPKYTVSTDILIDPSNLQVVPTDLYAQPAQADNQLRTAGSKLRVLTSGNVLARVVDELDLANDKEFYDPSPGGFSLSKLLGGGAASTTTAKTDPKIAALGALEGDVSTKADDNSYVAEMSVSAQSPDKAIQISNAIVQAFQDELAKAEADGAGRAAAALDDRLNGLKSAVETAEQKVEAYKQQNNLLSTNGQLVSSQTMSALNGELVTAQSHVIDAQAAYDAVLAAGRNATPSDSAAATALSALRDKADTLRQQLDSESMVFGPRHPTILRLAAQYNAANAQLTAEIARVVSGARSTLDQAKAALAALQAKQKSLTSGVFADNAAQVGLNELQRDADSKTAIYQSFLARAQQITQSEQIDTTNVRVISTAVPPADRSWPPRPALMIGVGGVLGFVFGLLLAVVFGVRRDMRQAPRRADAAIAG